MNLVSNVYKKIRFPFKIILASSMYLFIYKKVKTLKMLSINETLDYLINNPHLSIARYGDGKLEMLHYKNIGFQTFNKKPSDKLVEVLNDVEKTKIVLCVCQMVFLIQKILKLAHPFFGFFIRLFSFINTISYFPGIIRSVTPQLPAHIMIIKVK